MTHYGEIVWMQKHGKDLCLIWIVLNNPSVICFPTASPFLENTNASGLRNRIGFGNRNFSARYVKLSNLTTIRFSMNVQNIHIHYIILLIHKF